MPTGSILVADDDAAIRTVLNQALSRAGLHVQRRVGARHGRHVAQALSSRLDDDQLIALRDLCEQILAAHTTNGDHP